MQITFKINQQESIRRGISCSSTHKLDLDLAEFDEEQRDLLASGFDTRDGSFDLKLPQSGDMLRLPEPTAEGVREALAAYLVEKDEQSKIIARREVDQIACLDKAFAEGDVTKTRQCIAFVDVDKDNNIVPTHTGFSSPYLHKEWKDFYPVDTPGAMAHLKSLKRSPEGKQIERMMGEENELARSEALGIATEKARTWMKGKERKSLAEKQFKEWAKVKSPELIALLIEESMPWKQAAMRLLVEEITGKTTDDAKDVTYQFEEGDVGVHYLEFVQEMRDRIKAAPEWAKIELFTCQNDLDQLVDLTVAIGDLPEQAFFFAV